MFVFAFGQGLPGPGWPAFGRPQRERPSTTQKRPGGSSDHANVQSGLQTVSATNAPEAVRKVGKVTSASIAAILEEGLKAEQAFVGNQNGDAKGALESAAMTVEAVYSYPFQNHACMEPMNATALYTTDKCEVWVPTQDGEASFAAVLPASGLPHEKCEVYKINPGGGFGRRSAFQDYVTQAVVIAKQIPGTPIKLLWTREEDMLQGRFHPVMQCKLVGGFDASKNLTALHMRLSGQSILAAVRPAIVEQNKGKDPLVFQGVADAGEHALGYSVPNLLIDHAMRNTHVPPGFWRGVNINQNCIFMECFMDELADAVGQDELEFRRKLMSKHPRNLGVLNAAAERIGWGKPAPQGVHRGLAHMKAFNAYVAAAAERRADYLRRRACGAQRLFQGHGQAYPFVPAEEL